MTYPTWLKLRDDLWISEEKGPNGIPDFIVARAKRASFWRVSRRDMTISDQTYGSAREAMRAIDYSCLTVPQAKGNEV